MSVDVFVKRYFSALLLAAVALAAFFQARGVGYLFASALAPEAGIVLPPVPHESAATTTKLSADPIKERNPFDSVTGPLIGESLDLPENKRGPIEVTDPLAVPACPGLKVLILTESDVPTWSFAAIQGPSDPHPMLRRVGDSVGDKKVAYIGFNPRNQTPTVWMESDTLCQASLFGAEPPPAQAKPEPAATGTTAPNSRAVSPEIAAKIKKISDTEYEIDRSAVDKILEDQSALMASARIVPEQKDGKVVGVRLFGIRPETLLGTMGFQNGDRLEQINGFDMGSPEKALEAYARLRTADNLAVKLNRRGQPVSVDYRIK